MVQQTIPASNIVSVSSGAVSETSSGFLPQGLMMTLNPLLPPGTIQAFTSQDEVGALFGTATGTYSEYQNAGYYFSADEFNTNTPKSLLIYSWIPSTGTTPYTRGVALSTLPDLATLQAVTVGTLVVNFGGTTYTATAIDLSSAGSFSAMAAIIQTRLQVALGTLNCTFDSITNAFTVSDDSVGIAVDYIVDSGSGAGDQLAQRMKITQAAGAILAQGQPATTPTQNMANVILQTTNFVDFTYNFDVTGDTNFSTIMELAAWVGTQDDKYEFFAWAYDANLLVVPQNTTTAPYYLASNGFGTIASNGKITFNVPLSFYASNPDFVFGQMGTIASVDYTQPNARVSLSSKTYPGIVPFANNQIQFNQALLNGCNFYGAYGTRGNVFNMSFNGSLGGIFLWEDNQVNQAWLVDAVQVAQMTYLNTVPVASFADLSPLRAVILGVLEQGVTNGVIQSGNTFSAQQTAILKAEAGVDITPNLTANGYYLQMVAPTAAQRANRTYGTINIWYTNGGSINTISNLVTLVI